MNNKSRAELGWAKFLNPQVLRDNLISASIFLAAFEMLQASIIDQIRNFFCSKLRDGEWIPNEDYRTHCLSLDKSPLRASLLWLQKMSVIDDVDIDRVDLIRKHRNELAHELPKFLGDADSELNVQLFAGIYELVSKIDRWWIREVEMPTNPHFDGREIQDNEITSGNMIFIQLMIQIATGVDSGEFWEEYKNHFGTVKESQ